MVKNVDCKSTTLAVNIIGSSPIARTNWRSIYMELESWLAYLRGVRFSSPPPVMSVLTIEHNTLVHQYLAHLSVAGILKRHPRKLEDLLDPKAIAEMLNSEELYTILGFQDVKFISENKQAKVVIEKDGEPILTRACIEFETIRESSS